MREGEQEDRWEEREACRLFDSELQDYLEGEERAAVAGHARDCFYCGTLLADLAQIRSVSRTLPQEEPPARVWARVRAALLEEGVIHAPRNFWQRWFLSPKTGLSPAAAAALACMLLAGFTLLQRSRHSGFRNLQPQPPVVEGAMLDSTMQDLERSYQARAATLDPSVKATYQKGLESLNGEIEECLDSVRREPNNTLAHDYLNTAYAEKAQILQSAVELDDR